jgi:8-oxo-dGTP diphosphatase
MITCVFEDGDKGLLRHVTLGAIVIKDNKVLLEKRASHLNNPNKYALPGGFLNRDETITEATKREVLEETGYEIDDLKLFVINSMPDRKGEDRQNVDFIFLAKAGEKVAKPDKEVQGVDWFDLENLPNEEEFAFDHFDNLLLYKKYQKENFSLPIFTS